MSTRAGFTAACWASLILILAPGISAGEFDSQPVQVPLNFSVSQLLRLGKQPVSFALNYRHYLDTPPGGPDWGLSFTVTLLFPK